MIKNEDRFWIKSIEPNLLKNEKQLLLQLIRSLVPNAYTVEVGSTAIEDLVGKQDLDFLIRVKADDFQHTRQILDTHFARNEQQLSAMDYQGYLIPSSLDAAIQLTIEGSPHDTFEKFLELLKGNESLRKRYNEMKKSWNGKPMHEYQTAKREFIEQSLCSKKND